MKNLIIYVLFIYSCTAKENSTQAQMSTPEKTKQNDSLLFEYGKALVVKSPESVDSIQKGLRIMQDIIQKDPYNLYRLCTILNLGKKENPYIWIGDSPSYSDAEYKLYEYIQKNPSNWDKILEDIAKISSKKSNSYRTAFDFKEDIKKQNPLIYPTKVPK